MTLMFPAYRTRKTAMASECKRLGINIADIKGFNARTDAWGPGAWGVAWRLSDYLHEHGHPEIASTAFPTKPFVAYLCAHTKPQRLLLDAVGIWFAKRGQTHYSYPAHSALRMQCPPLPGVAQWTDCSGMIRCIWQQLGWPDPAATAYRDWGNSEGMLAHARARGKLIPLGNEKLGDIVTYSGGVGHAELVVARGKVFTNGNEAGPYYRAIGKHSGVMHICRLAPFL